MPEQKIPAILTKTTYDVTKLLPIIPAGLAIAGALIAYKKGGCMLCLAGGAVIGFVIGKAITNQLKYGNLVGWR